MASKGGQAPQFQPNPPHNPPTRRLIVVALLAVLLILVLIITWLGRTFLRTGAFSPVLPGSQQQAPPTAGPAAQLPPELPVEETPQPKPVPLELSQTGWHLLALNACISEQALTQPLKDLFSEFPSSALIPRARRKDGKLLYLDARSEQGAATSFVTLPNAFWLYLEQPVKIPLSPFLDQSSPQAQQCASYRSLAQTLAKNLIKDQTGQLDAFRAQFAQEGVKSRFLGNRSLNFLANPTDQPISLASFNGLVPDVLYASEAEAYSAIKERPGEITWVAKSYEQLLAERYVSPFYRFNPDTQQWQKLTPQDSIPVNEAVVYFVKRWPVVFGE